MLRRPPSSTRTDTLFPYTTLFRSGGGGRPEGRAIAKAPAWHKRSALLLRRPEKRGYACTAIRQVGSGRYCCKRSEEHTSELQSLMRISYAVFCLKKTNKQHTMNTTTTDQQTKHRQDAKHELI